MSHPYTLRPMQYYIFQFGKDSSEDACNSSVTIIYLYIIASCTGPITIIVVPRPNSILRYLSLYAIIPCYTFNPSHDYRSLADILY